MDNTTHFPFTFVSYLHFVDGCETQPRTTELMKLRTGPHTVECARLAKEKEREEKIARKDNSVVHSVSLSLHVPVSVSLSGNTRTEEVVPRTKD